MCHVNNSWLCSGLASPGNYTGGCVRTGANRCQGTVTLPGLTHTNVVLKTVCSPMYTAQLWWNNTVASIYTLHVAYNNVFRLLINQPKYCSASTMFKLLNIPCVPDSKAVIRNLVYKFIRRLDASYNKLVIAIIDSDIKWQSRIRRHWIKMLYKHKSF